MSASGSSRKFFDGPTGRPNFIPSPLRLAKASLVRALMKSRSISATRPSTVATIFDCIQHLQGVAGQARNLRHHSAAISHATSASVQHLYRPGYRYAKAGVMLMDLRPDTHQQLKRDIDTDRQNAPQLMHAMDTLNDRFGRGTVRLASTGTPTQHRPWSMRQDRLTPGYTTYWEGMAWTG